MNRTRVLALILLSLSPCLITAALQPLALPTQLAESEATHASMASGTLHTLGGSVVEVIRPEGSFRRFVDLPWGTASDLFADGSTVLVAGDMFFSRALNHPLRHPIVADLDLDGNMVAVQSAAEPALLPGGKSETRITGTDSARRSVVFRRTLFDDPGLGATLLLRNELAISPTIDLSLSAEVATDVRATLRLLRVAVTNQSTTPATNVAVSIEGLDFRGAGSAEGSCNTSEATLLCTASAPLLPGATMNVRAWVFVDNTRAQDFARIGALGAERDVNPANNFARFYVSAAPTSRTRPLR